VICVSLTQQGGDTIFGPAFPSATKWYAKADENKVKLNKGALFLGLSIGVNTATPQESVENNVVIGGCYVDEIGGRAGVSGDATRWHGIGPLRPYAAAAVGDGFQVESGRKRLLGSIADVQQLG
jgi:hypothetical protein